VHYLKIDGYGFRSLEVHQTMEFGVTQGPRGRRPPACAPSEAGQAGPPHCTTESRGHDMAGDATVIAMMEGCPAGLRSAARPRTQPVRE
jgi:hypothetical protein